MTNKLDKKLHEQHAKRLQAIISAQSNFAQYLTRPEFSTLLKLELNTLAEIEKKLPDDKFESKFTSSSLVKEFNNLTKEEFKLGIKFKYEDEGDLIDNVNYLPTYCKNIFKVNIDDVVSGKKVNVENPNINLRAKPEAGDEPMMDAAAAFNMGAMGYGAGPYDNPYLMGKAYATLNKDIKDGKVYQFKTKPKQIPLMKWILTVLLSLSILALIVTAIFTFMATGLQVKSTAESGATGTISAITNGIFYIIVGGFGGYTLYVTLSSILKKHGRHNENSLYQFNWYFYLSFIILGLLITLLDLRVTWFHSWFNIIETSGVHVIGFDGWKLMIIISAALIGLCIPPMIIGAVYAPKVDKDKLESILQQYINDANAHAPVPPKGAEVQKPVDVKPSEPKKDTAKKSDDKSKQPKK